MIRRICGPRRVVLCWLKDDDGQYVDKAIDPSMDSIAYRDSLFDETYIKIKSGETPFYFTIEPMTRRQKDQMENYVNVREKAAFAVRCGLKNIENYYLVDDKGEKIAPLFVKEEVDGKNILTEKTIDSLDFEMGVLVGLFFMIRHISEPPVPFSKS